MHSRFRQACSPVRALTSNTLLHDFGNHPACPERQSALSLLAWSHARPLLEPVQQGSMPCEIQDKVLMSLLLATRLPRVNTSQVTQCFSTPGLRERCACMYHADEALLHSTGMAGHSSAATYMQYTVMHRKTCTNAALPLQVDKSFPYF